MKIKAASWNRFVSTNLAVAPDAMGTKHRFRFEDRTVSVQVPDTSMADRDDRYDNVAQCRHWKTVDSTPLSYEVYKIDVYVNLKETLDIPPAMLRLSPKQDHLISNKTAEYLEQTCQDNELFARMAYEYWLNLLRWKTMNWRIGQPELSDQKSGWGTYLVATSSLHPFWIGTHRITAHLPHIVTHQELNNVELALKKREIPPIWIQYLFDGQYKHANEDLNGCILSLAISCESIFRRIIEGQVPSPRKADPQIYNAMGEVNIRSLFNHITNFKFWDKEWKSNCDWPSINQLFNYRNDIIHAGFRRFLDKEKVEKILRAVISFVLFASERL